jgi:hypothetical protein
VSLKANDWYNLKREWRLLFGLLHNDDQSLVHLRKRALLNCMVGQLESRGTPDVIPPAGPHIFDVSSSPFATEKLSMVFQIVQLFGLKTPVMFAQFLEPARLCLLSLYHPGIPTACKRPCSSAWTIA